MQNELQLKINKTKTNIAEMREVEKSKCKSLITDKHYSLF